MPEEVFYRKFRPDQLHKLVGQKPVVELLTKSCEKEAFHHAWFFCGSSGSGKTTAARILAAIVNCERRAPHSAKACGECPACQAIKAGCCPDVIELDSSNEGGKVEIQRVLESGSYAPVDAKRKVFIIDEFHEVTKAGIGALLKPLEEPLPTTMFILCTSEPAKVPPVISSRCLRVMFRPVPAETISFYLGKLAEHLKAQCEKEALDHIASISNGNMRHALNYFQSMLLVAEQPVTGAAALEFLGLAGREALYGLAEQVAAHKIGEALDTMESLLATTPDAGQVCLDLSEIFRNAMLFAAGAEAGLSVTPAEAERCKALGAAIGGPRLAAFSGDFADAYMALSLNKNPKWVLEALIVKLSEPR